MAGEGRDIPVVREARLFVTVDGVTWTPWDGLVELAPGAGGLTNAELRATPVPVLATIDTTGLATTAGQLAGNASLTSIDGKLTLAATSTSQATQQTALDAIKAAVETLDNFISGAKGLVTEDNSAAMKTAVEKIDDFISGARGLVTEDNSAAILSALGVLAGYLDGVEGGQALQATAVNQATEIASLATIAALSKAEDAAHVSSDPGVPLLTVRQDDPALLTNSVGDYQIPATDAFGRLWVNGSTVTQPVIDPVARALQMRALLFASVQPTNGFVPQEIPAFFAGF